MFLALSLSASELLALSLSASEMLSFAPGGPGPNYSLKMSLKNSCFFFDLLFLLTGRAR
jgi:hypothetical protein